MKLAMTLLLIVAAVSSTGCAFGTRNAVLTYPPNQEENAEKTVESSETNFSAKQIVLQVKDDRSDKRRIGNVRNGFGMDTASVVTKNDIAEWVEKALTQDLNKAGYSVIKASNINIPTDAIGLMAEVRNVYCDVYLTYDADVNLAVEITSDGKTLSRKHYNGEGSVGMNWAATASSYAESLSLALQNAIALIINDLQQLD